MTLRFNSSASRRVAASRPSAAFFSSFHLSDDGFLPKAAALVLASGVALFSLCPGPARAAERQVLHGHVPAAAARAQPRQRLSAAKRLDLSISLPLRNRGALTSLLGQIYDPASPNYRQYLTAEQFAQRFGPA